MAVYERILGPGKVEDLFAAPGVPQIQEGAPSPGSHDTVSVAQQVMKQNTTELDAHHEMEKHNKDEGDNKDRGEEKEDWKKKDLSGYIKRIFK